MRATLALLVMVIGCGEGESALTGEEFNLEYEALFCETAQECSLAAVCGEVILMGDPGECEFDSDQGRACLDADWECELYDGTDVVVDPPTDCLHVFNC